ncbi:hypothetical protein, partial [Erythrobacter sp. CCH5-A1]|uniref:hypothetical protein n=1 Tax=Erythrobacter sp. CCH5-A1 TaxID=1768792 RepID=UPI0018D23D45
MAAVWGKAGARLAASVVAAVAGAGFPASGEAPLPAASAGTGATGAGALSAGAAPLSGAGRWAEDAGKRDGAGRDAA